MLSRDDYKFILLPWEHQGARFDPRPDAITTLHFAGAHRIVLLKAKANRLFFRFADWPSEPGCDAIFAVTTPFLANTHPAEQFFHEGIERKQVARYTTFAQSIERKNQDLTTRLWLTNENGAHRSGWAREWCGGDWIAWEAELPCYSNHSIWDEQWYGSFEWEIYNRVALTVAHRRFSEADRQNIPIRWERGSCEELSRLLRAYFCLFSTASYEINESYEERWQDRPPETRPVRAWAWNVATSITWLSTTYWDGKRVGTHCDLMDSLTPRWAELITQHNCPVGLTWHYKGHGDTECRENWWCETPTFDLDVPLPFSYPPSQHEQMEARLFLRNWLRDKVPADEIEAWFSPNEIS